jgi:hypothetical protein
MSSTPEKAAKNLQFGFFLATLLPYAVSLGAVLKGKYGTQNESQKIYWYALGFLAYLIATLASQIIAANSLKKMIDAGTSSDLDRSNYQYTTFSAIGTGVLISVLVGFVVKVYRS